MSGKLVLGPIVVLALALGACGTSSDEVDASKGGTGGDTEKVSGGGSTTTTTPEVTADPPLAFDGTATEALPPTALQSNLAGDVTTSFTTLHGRTAYIVEPAHLRAVDVLTGDGTWEATVEGAPADPDAQAGPFVNDAGPRPPAVSDDGETVVAAVPVSEPGEGTTPGHEAISVLAVDAGTGEERWTAEIDVSDEVAGFDGQGAITEVVAITDEAVVVTYTNEGATTAAIDPSTQETLWQRDDYGAGAVVDDIVVGSDGNVAENSSMSQITAVDLATGEERWAAGTQSSAVDVIPAHDDLVVVDRTDYGSGDPSLLFLDPATGEERARVDGESSFGSNPFGPCEYDEASVLLCHGFDTITAYDATTGTDLWSLPDETANRVAPSVTVVWHGAVYGTTENGPVVLDAETGEDLSTEPGLAPHWVSEYAGIGLGDDGTPTAYPVKET
jgi:hypothetical protein